MKATSCLKNALCLLLGAVIVGSTASVHAQRISFSGDWAYSAQSVSIGLQMVDFTHNGNGTPPELRFDFSNPAYGVTYTRPNFYAHVALGQQAAASAVEPNNRDLQLLDATVFSWASLYPLRRLVSDIQRFYLPVGILVNYRRVKQDGNDTNDFNFTSTGMGIGIGYDRGISDFAVVEARLIPMIAFSIRSFGDASGSSRLLEGELLVHIFNLFRQYGVTIGYTFRSQVWNLSASEVFSAFDDEAFDYRTLNHTIRVGVNW